MNFKIGDKVVCVNVTPLEGCRPTQLVLHKEYTVLGINHCQTCGVMGLHVGLHKADVTTHLRCSCGNRTNGESRIHHFADRFVKLDTIEDAITELLKETKIEYA